MPLVAVPLAAVLVALSLLHVYWAVFGVSTGVVVPSHADGTPVFRPGRIASLGVAAALIIAAAIVLSRAHVLPVTLPSVVVSVGIWGVAAAFAARAVGDFRYAGFFRRVRRTPFAHWDARLFTPLCAVIALAVAVVAMSA